MYKRVEEKSSIEAVKVKRNETFQIRRAWGWWWWGGFFGGGEHQMRGSSRRLRKTCSTLSSTKIRISKKRSSELKSDQTGSGGGGVKRGKIRAFGEERTRRQVHRGRYRGKYSRVSSKLSGSSIGGESKKLGVCSFS